MPEKTALQRAKMSFAICFTWQTRGGQEGSLFGFYVFASLSNLFFNDSLSLMGLMFSVVAQLANTAATLAHSFEQMGVISAIARRR